jgi:hypothetical protein
LPRLYVANCTKQGFIVQYVLDHLPNGDLKPPRPGGIMPTHQLIPPGRQLVIAGEVSMEQIESLVRQLSPFGALAEMEAKQARQRNGRIPLVWNTEQAVSAETIRLTDAHNQALLLDEGKQRRLAAAIIADEALNNQLGMVTPMFEVDYETESVEFGDDELPYLEEGVRVERPGREAAARGGKKVSKTRKAA